jgi:hypothetical protein
MLQDTPLAFWTSNQVMSYTELQAIRRRKYTEHSSRILKEVRENLKSFSKARSRQEAFRILSSLTILALDLSCYNSTWVDFDNAVFELMVLPSKASLSWTHKYLCGIMKTTLQRVSASTQPVKRLVVPQ